MSTKTDTSNTEKRTYNHYYEIIDELPSTSIKIDEYKTGRKTNSTHNFNNLYFDPKSSNFYTQTKKIKLLKQNPKFPNSIVARSTAGKSIRISFREFQKYFNEKFPENKINIWQSKRKMKIENIEDEA